MLWLTLEEWCIDHHSRMYCANGTDGHPMPFTGVNYLNKLLSFYVEVHGETTANIQELLSRINDVISEPSSGA